MALVKVHNPLGPLPDMAQIVQYSIKGSHNGVAWANTGYLQYTGTAPTVADLATIATGIGTAWNTNFAPVCHANVTQDAVRLQDMTNRASSINEVTGMAHAGTRTGTDDANNICCVVSWQINRRYKGGHPRWYVPAGVVADYTSGRLWTTAFTTAMNNAATAMRTAMNALTSGGATYKMVSMELYRKNPATGLPAYVVPPVPYTVQGNKVHGRVDTQRRRLGRETP